MNATTPTFPGAAILFSEMTPGAAWTDRFNQWYDTEHIPIRVGCPGFLSARRYREREGDSFLAVYELAEPEALATPEYREVKDNPSALTREMLDGVTGFTRYLSRQSSVMVRTGMSAPEALDAAILYAVWFEVPAAARSDFDAWYEREHGPMLLDCSDWLMIRRFEVVDGTPECYTHLALHYLRDASALSSPQRQAARDTEWRARLAASDWFKPNYSVFAAHGQRQLAQV